MKKVIYGRNSTGVYCNLYSKCWFGFFILDTLWGSSSSNLDKAENQMLEWKEQYSIPDNLVIKKHI